MLKLKDVTVNVQNFGTILAVFLTAPDKAAIEERFNSYWNHGATGGELEWWCDTCALFWIYSSAQWSASEKLERAMTYAALFEILQSEDTRGISPMARARAIARARIDAIEPVTWYKAGASVELFGMGDSVHAERGTGNFDDDVVAGVLGRGGKDTLAAFRPPTEEEEQEEAA